VTSLPHSIRRFTEAPLQRSHGVVLIRRGRHSDRAPRLQGERLQTWVLLVMMLLL